MILPGGKYRVYLATRPVDFRKGHAGLSLVVQNVLGHDPYGGALFLFRSKRGDQLKCLVWDQTGLVMIYRKLEGGAFHWPKPADGVIRLPPARFAVADASEKAVDTRKKGRKPQSRNRGNLPEHLPRIEQVIVPESNLCPCGCGEMVKVGEDRSERLVVIPARFRVLVTIRPKYVCRSCAGKSHAQAPAPEWLAPRGLPTEAMVAHSMVAKFGDYLPFYRQADIYRRQGIDLDRTMLANWSGRAAQLLQPVIDAMIAELLRRSLARRRSRL